MKVIRSKSEINNLPRGMVLTIGNFDGVHTGHQLLLERAREYAERNETGLAVMTFDPHPAAVLHPEKRPGVLTPFECKRFLLEQSGAQNLIVITDSYQLLNLSPRDFVTEFLVKHIRPRALFEGKNFKFGYGRSGDVELLSNLGNEHGFEVFVVESKLMNVAEKTYTVSSTLIRHLLEDGDVTNAATALGRYYRLSGKVVSGRGKGSEIGFPTANLDAFDQIVPAEGVYAGFVEIGEDETELCTAQKRLPAAISIGRAKTFMRDHPLLLEAHILTPDVPKLYGKWLAMDFVRFLRVQQRFESVEELKKQIKRDCEEIESILKSE